MKGTEAIGINARPRLTVFLNAEDFYAEASGMSFRFRTRDLLCLLDGSSRKLLPSNQKRTPQFR
jgi:hypothetical protein